MRCIRTLKESLQIFQKLRAKDFISRNESDIQTVLDLMKKYLDNVDYTIKVSEIGDFCLKCVDPEEVKKVILNKPCPKLMSEIYLLLTSKDMLTKDDIESIVKKINDYLNECEKKIAGSRLRKRINELENRVKELEDKVGSYERVVKVLESDKDRLESTVKRLEKEVEVHRARVREVTLILNEYAASSSSVFEIDVEKTFLESKVKFLENRVKELEGVASQVNVLKEKNDVLKVQVKSLNELVDAYESLIIDLFRRYVSSIDYVSMKKFIIEFFNKIPERLAKKLISIVGDKL